MTIQPVSLRFIGHRSGGGRGFVLMMAAFTAAALLLAPLAHAGGKPRPGFYSYSIHHALFGEIGSQTISLARAGRNVTVTMEARVKIRFLFVTLLRLRTRSREIWREGRMIAFEGRSEEDGETLIISARAAGKGMTIEGPRGSAEIAAPVALTNPWNPAVLDAPMVIEPTSGALLSIRAKAAGSQWIEVAGRAVSARKYVVTGDMEAENWFAKDGTLCRVEFFKTGGRVTIALVSFTPSPKTPGDQVAEQARQSPFRLLGRR